MIKESLGHSVDLRAVGIRQDAKDFENVTNRDFNTSYENDVVSNNANTVRPI